ncbi:MAG: serine--tRNA ligase [Acidobacteria bacterium]|nr:serine--tRNA ligase [Acidobacteriota bacterium]
MLELAYVRDHLDRVEAALRARGYRMNLDEFRHVDAERRGRITEVEQFKAQKNKLSQEAGRLKQRLGVPLAASDEGTELLSKMQALGFQIDDLEAKVKQLDIRLQEILLSMPNIPHSSVPAGDNPERNQEVRRWGEPPQFSFAPKPHWDLGETLGILDLKRAAKIAGSRFAVYAGWGARLERALANFMLDVHTREHGYVEVLPPFIVNSAALVGTGNLPKFAGDLFKLEGTDYWLIPTAEVPVTNLFRGEILAPERLPVKLCAWTANFRSEAGSHGKETRGIVRQHQFQKVELVKFARPEQGYQELESLTRDAEAILQKLGLAYRVVALCTGDLGFAAAKTYDLEVWLPGQNSYKEISSCSNFEAFQARRAGLRYRLPGKTKSDYVHTLNGSGLAIGRTWMAIVENYQQGDGSVVIPEMLRPYLHGVERLEPCQTGPSLDSFL